MSILVIFKVKPISMIISNRMTKVFLSSSSYIYLLPSYLMLFFPSLFRANAEDGSPLGIWFNPDQMLRGLFCSWPSAWAAGQSQQAVESSVVLHHLAKAWAAWRPLHYSTTLSGQLSTHQTAHKLMGTRTDLFMIWAAACPYLTSKPLKSRTGDAFKVQHFTEVCCV